MFQSSLMTTLMLVILVALAAPLLISVVMLIAKLIRAKEPTPTKWDWLKDFLIPLITPFLVVALGFWFAIQSDKRQREESERQRQASAMRDLIVSQDRADTSFLLAVDTQLSNHFHRYLLAKKGDKSAAFDEEAAFFFYGMHRASLINLHATEGNIVFPRLWMEETFENLANHVVETILGGTELDPALAPIGQAAIYEYFGRRSESNPAERTKHSGAGPSLFRFHCLLHDIVTSADPAATLEADALKEEFRNFQERLHSGKLDPSEVINTLFAMDALDVYAYNNTFADWYGTHPQPIPRNPPPDPPAGFSESTPKDMREKIWKLILKFSS